MADGDKGYREKESELRGIGSARWKGLGALGGVGGCVLPFCLEKTWKARWKSEVKLCSFRKGQVEHLG